LPIYRLGVAAVLLALTATPRASATQYSYNGVVLVNQALAKTVKANASMVVSPTLTAPNLVLFIVRRQGTITRSELQFVGKTGLATYTIGYNTPTPNVVTGTFTIFKTYNGSTVSVDLTTGNPTGTILFHIQPGATTATFLLDFVPGVGTVRQYFTGTVPSYTIIE
jgi:hypothetical protein